ncbi:MAG: hypothetical protein MK085_02655 [Phycisphaerales bacterium]|nr:hypothetical protein [Phycisphaerales bacterium]
MYAMKRIAGIAIACTMMSTAQVACADEDHSVARRWMDLLLDSIRTDYARPVVHARNLFHVSAAMWDGWSVWENGPTPWLLADEVIANEDIEAARNECISHAAYQILLFRFNGSPGFKENAPRYIALMEELGYDPDFSSSSGDSPAAVGNRIAAEYILFGMFDGANEANDYLNESYIPVNEPLLPPLPGPQDIVEPNRWQPLALDFFVDQAGNIILDGYPEFLGAEWGSVTPFALQPKDCVINPRDGFDYFVYHDPGPPALLGTAREEEYLEAFEQVVIWSSHLDPADGEMWDISPNQIGNTVLPEDPEDYPAFYDYFEGGDAGQGYTQNPVTGEPYAEQWVPRGDYGRVLAEFWADGPDSETPPGHWFVILNDVNDHPQAPRRIGGVGPVLGALEWDVKSYFALGGCMHDSAIAAWGVKGWYDYIRPISAIRWMAENGQRSDPKQPSHHPNGLRLLPGLIEVVTDESSAPGERHEHLRGEFDEHLGKMAAWTWRGPEYIEEPETDMAGVGWILLENWWPYQRPTFVTPNFAGYVSGHSTYSRAAAELMTRLTGSQYFPGGLAEYVAPANAFLVFEEGPSQDVVLQWPSYFDASDQCSLSRIWGGIHPITDDLPGRVIGSLVGPDAWEQATNHFGPVETCPADLDNDGIVGGGDLGLMLQAWGCVGECPADLDGNGIVDGGDMGLLIASWHWCG